MNITPIDKDRFARNATLEAPRVDNMPKTLASYKNLSADQKSKLNEQRRLAINGTPLIATPNLAMIGNLVEKRIRDNQGRTGATRGLMLNGAAGGGKTQAVLDAAYSLHRQSVRTKGERTAEGHERIPIVYIITEGAAKPRSVAQQILDFMGIPNARRDTLTTLNRKLDCAFNTYEVELLILDDAQHLANERQGRDAASQIKGIMEKSGATVVLVGFQLRKSPIFSGEPARQLRKRMTINDVDKFHLATDDDKIAWRSFLKQLESQMPLLSHKPRYLADNHWQYIYDRCESGNIATAVELVTQAALQAIETGTERITKDLMNSVQLDIEAERSLATVS